MDYRVVGKKLQILQGLAIENSRPVTGWQARTADHIAPGEYRFDVPWRKTPVPVTFPAGKTVFLRTEVTVPAGLPLDRTYLSFDFPDMEGLLRLDGAAYAGIDWAHPRVVVPKRGRLEVELEFMSVPGIWQAPEPASRRGTFGGGSLCVVDREIESFCYDLRFAWETARTITDPRRKPLLDEAIEAALLAVDLTLPRERLLSEVARAGRLLRQKLGAIAPDREAGSLYAVGHTHIDTAWLWPLRETVRKCGRTFSTACRLMERFPDYRFTCSQPQLYQYTKQHHPEVFREIKKWVKTGRWETAGAMWVEADCNATSGESLIRQMLYGLDFFRKEFGTRPRMCWLPDVFGYPASLPTILAGCGVKYFYTYKLHWQAKNPFPVHLFRWRGLDGSEVVAHVVNHVGAYNNMMTPEHLAKGWDLYAQKAEYPEVIFPFGFGDGGGGVTEDMMEMFKRAKGQFPGLPAVRLGTAEGYFDDVVAARPALPLWDGELYVETHRGTYTTQSEMKRANRLTELRLREAEIIGSLASLAGQKFDAAALRGAWEATLLQQFHDILPGSSIGEVYAEALPSLARVQAEVGRVAEAGMAALGRTDIGGPANALCVFNTLSWERQDVVTAEIPDAKGVRSITASDGTRHAVQVVGRSRGRATIVCRPGALPALGYAVLPLSSEPADAFDGKLSVSMTRIENDFFRIALNREGGITRLYDKRSRRDVLAPGTVGNELQLLQDGPEFEDAWNVHDTNDKRHYPFEGATTVRLVETGPVRGVVRVKRTHRGSTFEQDIVVYAGVARIDFVTRVDWQERQTLLKVAFPLDVRATRATYEVQFGACERATHRNTSWEQQKFEVPAQRWADLSETGFGVSLLNDCRYGYDALENVLRLTLLRSASWPDPQADRGRHEFTYALLPHAGGWAEGETVRRAWELNVPATARPVRCAAGEPEAHNFITIDGLDVVVETLKPAEDGRGLILRLYEPNGARGEATVRLRTPVKRVVECNLVEENGAAVTVRQGAFRVPVRPFAIRTFRLLTK